MAIRIRVYPQPGSVGAQRNTIARKNEQIVALRQQVNLLRQQLNAFAGAASLAGQSSFGQMGQMGQFGTPGFASPFGAAQYGSSILQPTLLPSQQQSGWFGGTAGSWWPW